MSTTQDHGDGHLGGPMKVFLPVSVGLVLPGLWRPAAHRTQAWNVQFVPLDFIFIFLYHSISLSGYEFWSYLYFLCGCPTSDSACTV